jgi:hypothetical protein
MTLLDDRLHDTVATMLRAAPEPRPFESLRVPRNLDVPTRRPERRRNLVAAAVALVVVAAIVVTVAVVQSQRDDRSVPAGSVPVTHEVISYQRIRDASCAAREGEPRGFDESVTDVWRRSDGTAQRVITRYPDGSHYDVLLFGRDVEHSVLRYDAIYVEGDQQSRQVNCGLDGGTVLAPDELLGAFAGVRRVHNYRYGTRSTAGRNEIWQMDSSGGFVAPDGTPITSSKDRTRWIVDPSTGDVLERITSSDLGDFGRVVHHLRSERYETTGVPADFFDTAGFRRLDGGGGGGTSTTTLGATAR